MAVFKPKPKTPPMPQEPPKDWWHPPGFEPQGQYLATTDPDEKDARFIGTTFVQIARSGVGLKTPMATYLGLLYPTDTFQHQKIMVASQHGCALTCGGWLLCGGCRHPLLKSPYWGRNDAFSRLEVIARDYDDCWGGHDGEFSEGDLLMIGTDVPYDAPNRAQIIAQWGTPGHVMLVEKIEEDDEDEKDGDGSKTITTIDGGRGPIVRTQRKVTKDNRGRVWVSGFTKRRVWGSIRVARLEFDPDAQWHLPKGPGYPGLIG